MKRIGILTGGGDVPGLNPCIKAAYQRLAENGHEVVGIRRGWGGLLNFNPSDPNSAAEWTLLLDRNNTRTVDRTGGTFLHTSRTQPSKVRRGKEPEFLKGSKLVKDDGGDILDFTPHVLNNLSELKLDALIAIGGDDTLSYAQRLHSEGFPVVAVPKTMDNDVYGTDYCIGFSTAVSRSVEFINNLRTSTGSHERIAVVELFGRNSGETSLIAAYVSQVDRAIISEVPFSPEKLAEFLAKDKKDNPSHYAIMTISEGAAMVGGDIMETGPEDAYGHRKLGGIGQLTGSEIKRLTGENIIFQQVGYLMRCGEPDALDRMVAFGYAHLAADMILRGESGRLAALREGRYTTIPINEIIGGVKRVDVNELYDAENYKPKVVNMIGKPMFLY